MAGIRIRVRGRLSERLAGAFDGMKLVHRAGATELVGEFIDQAQLHGLITRVRDLGLDLESVAVLGAGPDKRRDMRNDDIEPQSDTEAK